MRKHIFSIFMILMIFPCYVGARTMNLCVDERNWYPFLYVDREDKLVHGIHFDIVAKALKTIGHDFIINAYPRRQCIDRAANMEADGMISVAYHPDITSFLNFPPGAETAKRSKWRIMQVDYMIVTHRTETYRFKGDIQTLPEPIRIPRGETIASELRQKGKQIDDGARDDRRNFLKLLRDKKGVVITTSVMAERLIKELKIIDQITIHSTPFKSQSYYLAFSNSTIFSEEEKEKLWVELTKWRDDFVFMLQLFATY